MPDDNRPIVIKVSKVSKDFLLPHLRTKSIKSAFTGVFKQQQKQKTTEVQHALKDISFEVRQGEFFGILGRNGSGKSTLLKILATIYQPTKGSAQTTGKLVSFIELGVGFNPELTGRENVYLNGALLGFSKDEIAKQYDDIVAFAELEQFMDQKLKNYSSGMQVRLAFSVATQAQADILLIDEVLAVGDIDFQRKCFEYFKQLKKAHTTVVFVSHNMSAVREFCDRAVLVEKSHIIAIGDAKDIANDYSQLFIDGEDGVESKQSTPTRDKRWGRGDVEIEKVETSLKGDEIVIKYEAVAHKPIDKLLYGLHISAADGQELTAVNNRLLLLPDVEAIDKGARLSFTWEVLNIFNDGNYTISLTLVDEADEVLDWYTDAASFRIKRPERSTTAILPPIQAKVEIDNSKKGYV